MSKIGLDYACYLGIRLVHRCVSKEVESSLCTSSRLPRTSDHPCCERERLTVEAKRGSATVVIVQTYKNELEAQRGFQFHSISGDVVKPTVVRLTLKWRVRSRCCPQCRQIQEIRTR